MRMLVRTRFPGYPRDGDPTIVGLLRSGAIKRPGGYRNFGIYRLADEYDAAQERGEVAGQGKPSTQEGLAKAADLGLSHKDIHEARIIRDTLLAPVSHG